MPTSHTSSVPYPRPPAITFNAPRARVSFAGDGSDVAQAVAASGQPGGGSRGAKAGAAGARGAAAGGRRATMGGVDENRAHVAAALTIPASRDPSPATAPHAAGKDAAAARAAADKAAFSAAEAEVLARELAALPPRVVAAFRGL